MNEKGLSEVGKKYVDKIQRQFDSKKLNDTGGGKDSISYRTEPNKLIIEGLERILFLEHGRRAGVAPPFKVIRDWAERKLNLPDEELDGISWAIVKKIEKSGTDILTDKTKGLQLEILLNDLNNELSKIIINFEAKEITDGLIKHWIK